MYMHICDLHHGYQPMLGLQHLTESSKHSPEGTVGISIGREKYLMKLTCVYGFRNSNHVVVF